jgi:hypothetical protein
MSTSCPQSLTHCGALILAVGALLGANNIRRHHDKRMRLLIRYSDGALMVAPDRPLHPLALPCRNGQRLRGNACFKGP